jgi:hypothetical protein
VYNRVPGMFPAKSGLTSSILYGFCRMNQRMAMSMGVVRQQVNRSAVCHMYHMYVCIICIGVVSEYMKYICVV